MKITIFLIVSLAICGCAQTNTTDKVAEPKYAFIEIQNVKSNVPAMASLVAGSIDAKAIDNKMVLTSYTKSECQAKIKNQLSNLNIYANYKYYGNGFYNKNETYRRLVCVPYEVAEKHSQARMFNLNTNTFFNEYDAVMSSDVIKKPKSNDTIFPMSSDLYSVENMREFDKEVLNNLKNNKTKDFSVGLNFK